MPLHPLRLAPFGTLSLDPPLSSCTLPAMKNTNYRFVLNLDPESRRKLALLQAGAIMASGRTLSAAEVVRKLIMEAPVKAAEGKA